RSGLSEHLDRIAGRNVRRHHGAADARGRARSGVAQVGALTRRGREDRPFLWLAPLFLLFAVLFLFPFVDLTRLSLPDATDATAPVHYTLGSYRSVLGSSEFLAMARVTAIFVAASIAGQLVFGLLIAALVCEGERRGLPGAALVRAVVLVGWVLP